MQRVYGLVDDELVHRIDEKAGEAKVSRAQWIRLAIESYLHRGGEDFESEAVNLRTEAVKLRALCGEQAQELTVLKDSLAVKDGELVHLQDVEAKFKKFVVEANQQWEENKDLKNVLNAVKKELDETKNTAENVRAKTNQLEEDLVAAQKEIQVAQSGETKALSALKAKEDEVSFLRSHVAQLTQNIGQLSLKPGEEETKKKSWWKFWK